MTKGEFILNLNILKEEALLKSKDIKDTKELVNTKLYFLGTSGKLTKILKEIKNLPPEARKNAGIKANEVKQAIEDLFKEKRLTNTDLEKEWLDTTSPGIPPKIGHLHIVTQAILEITRIFERIGFTRVRYPEVEWDWYSFGSLNFPPDHPARDDFETFFIDAPPDPHFGKMLLSPHTSSGQVREMQRVGKPPIRMINIAKCYRPNWDITHTPMFHQFEGLVIDRGINITHLKGTFDYFAREYFGKDRKIRLRPHHFQFTEPSFEVDITCGACNAKGCRLCKGGWLELCGSGMVHPNVLRAGKIDPKIYTGYAFGWGVERSFMMKQGIQIDDLRLLYSNDIRFLEQF
jgi:phenylalanyl-tRNA synthetase alpha chain